MEVEDSHQHCEVDSAFKSLKRYFNNIYSLSTSPNTPEHERVLRALGVEDESEMHEKKNEFVKEYVLETDEHCNLYWVRKKPEPQVAVKVTTKEVIDKKLKVTRRFTGNRNELTEERTITTPRGKKNVIFTRVFTDNDLRITTKVDGLTYVEEYGYELRKSTGYTKGGNKDFLYDPVKGWENSRL